MKHLVHADVDVPVEHFEVLNSQLVVMCPWKRVWRGLLKLPLVDGREYVACCRFGTVFSAVVNV